MQDKGKTPDNEVPKHHVPPVPIPHESVKTPKQPSTDVSAKKKPEETNRPPRPEDMPFSNKD